MKLYNSTSLTHYAATVADLFGVERPRLAEEPLEWVETALSDLCKDGFDRLFIYNPDAIAMWLAEKYPELFGPVLKNTQITVPFRTMLPSVTPVCFTTMYTGAVPAVHGTTVYEKRIVPIDSLFDCLLRAGKKIALVSGESPSMSKIFSDRYEPGKFDFFCCPTKFCGPRVDKVRELIVADEYDVIVLYTGDYDYIDHKYGPEAPESMAALRSQIQTFGAVADMIRDNWKKHDTLLTFSPDHGVHASPDDPREPGTHGSDSPLDLNILHYFGAIRHQVGQPEYVGNAK